LTTVQANEPPGYQVIASACIRCAGCATVAPGLFEVGPRAARASRAPASPLEHGLSRAAALLCPSGAIVRGGEHAGAATPPSRARQVLADSIYHHSLIEAENVRWRMGDLPLEAIDASQVTDGLRRLVRQVALSEATTFTASTRFLHEFADDADLSQWIAVWLYEEGRHPQAMMAWLSALGESVAGPDLVRARATTPFIRSRSGTLVMNVISEVIAAGRYLALARRAPEPALARIAAWLAADEARHGATFFRYARRQLERSTDVEAEKLVALKVLYFWLFERSEVQHPVNLFGDTAHRDPLLASAMDSMGLDTPRLERRLCGVVGELIELPLEGPEAVMPALRAQAARSRLGHARSLREATGGPSAAEVLVGSAPTQSRDPAARSGGTHG